MQADHSTFLKGGSLALTDALVALQSDETVRGWFPEAFVEVYLAHKRGEIAVVKGLTDKQKCARYALVY